MKAKKNLIAVLSVVCAATLLAFGFFYFLLQKSRGIDANIQGSASRTIDLPEVGLQFTAEASISDLTYTIKDLGNFGKAAYFSTRSLALADAACKDTSNSIGAIGVLSAEEWKMAEASQPSSTTTSTFDPEHPTDVLKLGNSYIIFDAPNTLCSSNKEAIKLEQIQEKSLLRSLSTLSMKAH